MNQGYQKWLHYCFLFFYTFHYSISIYFRPFSWALDKFLSMTLLWRPPLVASCVPRPPLPFSRQGFRNAQLMRFGGRRRRRRRRRGGGGGEAGQRSGRPENNGNRVGNFFLSPLLGGRKLEKCWTYKFASERGIVQFHRSPSCLCCRLRCNKTASPYCSNNTFCRPMNGVAFCLVGIPPFSESNVSTRFWLRPAAGFSLDTAERGAVVWSESVIS